MGETKKVTRKGATKKANHDDVMILPVLPLRDVVVYPNMVIPLFVGREKSVAALEAAMDDNKQIFLVAQRDATQEAPTINDIYTIGCVASILQLLRLPDGTVKVLAEGVERAKAVSYHEKADYLAAEIAFVRESACSEQKIEMLMQSTLTQFEQYVKLNKRVPSEILSSLSDITDPVKLADVIAAHMPTKLEAKQAILEADNAQVRLEILMEQLDNETDILQVERKIRHRVKEQMEDSQRRYYLREKRKAISEELGEAEGESDGLDILADKIKKSDMSKEAKEKAEEELNKLKMMPPMSAEATVSRNYLDVLVDLPWKSKTKIKHDLPHAEQTLDADHYGLEKVKERIIEYLAVQQRVKKLKGPVLCLVGPPGVGKTSLGESIARATGRKFARMSLGGVRDEAEIRGHRRTYIGALPGKVLQKLTKTKVNNPLFLLDEIDKMAMDYRGDPASALLEVLDPEQNHTFNDHYLEIDYDLSDIMFVCTANSMDIPSPLLDRMEVIRIPGYTEIEKKHIAETHLIPKQIADHGLKPKELSINTAAVLEVIRSYTREAGVRSLEREISKICRKVVKEFLLNPKQKTRTVTLRNLEKYLGVKRFQHDLASQSDQVGQVNGLAWTQVGGELLRIEAAKVPGKGKSTSTGQLGDVMQESIQAASTVVRSRAASLGIAEDFYEKYDVHIHVPEGATPKDGPSAGIGMCTAMVSVLTGIPVRSDVAMTGEITLRGEVLAIGGLKEKLLAAARSGIKTVLIPYENQRHLKEIPDVITQGLEIRPVRWIDEVLTLALTKIPQPCLDDSVKVTTKKTTGKRRKVSSKRATH